MFLEDTAHFPFLPGGGGLTSCKAHSLSIPIPALLSHLTDWWVWKEKLYSSPDFSLIYFLLEVSLSTKTKKTPNQLYSIPPVSGSDLVLEGKSSSSRGQQWEFHSSAVLHCDLLSFPNWFWPQVRDRFVHYLAFSKILMVFYFLWRRNNYGEIVRFHQAGYWAHSCLLYNFLKFLVSLKYFMYFIS